MSHLGDGSFYESAAERDSRFTTLIHQVAVSDPEWLTRFVPWLRDSAGMRTASVLAAAETARAFLDAGRPGGRAVIAAALQRADEPGELLAYWRSRYGRSIPKPVKRASVTPCSDSWASTRCSSTTRARTPTASPTSSRWSTRVTGRAPRRVARSAATGSDLFGYAIDRRYGRDEAPESLPMIAESQRLRAEAGDNPSVLLDAGRLKAAGLTWEDALSLAGPHVGKQELWTALVPLLGYFSLIRNMRNIDEAGVADDVAAAAAARIADPDQVRKSRLFPFRFLAAHQAVPSLRWGHPLELALNASLGNVPRLRGRTLILVDRSGSMFGPVSAKSGLNRADPAALFGSALAVRAEQADLVEFGSGSRLVLSTDAANGSGQPEALLKLVRRFGSLGGTNTADAVRRWFQGHDRVVIVTDEQAWAGRAGADPLAVVPDNVPAYTWNLGR